jgi:hypothetical protein
VYFFLLCVVKIKNKRKSVPSKNFHFPRLCHTTMPRKQKGREPDKGTQDITNFFGAASPSQRTANNEPTARVSAALPAARPAQRNLKLGQIDARSTARGRARNSDSEDEAGEEVLYSGTCEVLAQRLRFALHLCAH